MPIKLLIIGAAMLAAAFSADVLHARDTAGPDQIDIQELLVEPLAGDPDKDVVTHLYSFPPGTVLPWHIHPDAHEVAYVVEGDFTMEIAGEGRKELKPGESFYLAPNLVHRGMNEGTSPVKLFVVRIKPKAKPLVEEVQP